MVCRHRYSCSELSDADSGSLAEDDYQLGVEDLEAIHSVGQSMEEEQGLRKLLRSSSTTGNGIVQQCDVATHPKANQQQQQLGPLRSSGGMYGRLGLTPVQEEQPEQVCCCSGRCFC